MSVSLAPKLVIGSEMDALMLRSLQCYVIGTFGAARWQAIGGARNRPAVDDTVLRVAQLGPDVGHGLGLIGRVDHPAGNGQQLIAALHDPPLWLARDLNGERHRRRDGGRNHRERPRQTRVHRSLGRLGCWKVITD